MQDSHTAHERLFYETSERANVRRQHESCSYSNAQITVEIDFIESFFDFANYLDKVNPICAPECIDTVDKLLSLLAQK